MTERTAPLFDRLFASAVFGVGSAIGVRYPNSRLIRKIMGENPTRWYATRTHWDDMPAYASYAPDDEAGAFASTYAQGVRVATTGHELTFLRNQLEQKYGGTAIRAGAFRLGKAVVAAEIPGYDGDTLLRPSDELGEEGVILGLGTGVLHATIGAYHPEANVFVGAEYIVADRDPRPLELLAEVYPNTPRL